MNDIRIEVGLELWDVCQKIGQLFPDGLVEISDKDGGIIYEHEVDTEPTWIWTYLDYCGVVEFTKYL